MSYWTSVRRTKPYTEIGIRRVRCVRCGHPGAHQWQVCADGSFFRVLCDDCDVALNRLVLNWARDPDADTKVAEYDRLRKL